MVQDYERIYRETPQALGPPTPALVSFFEGLAGDGLRVLDVGCGQGRDALFIARHGHHVLGVDIAPSGIHEMMATAQREELAANGIVADLTEFTPEGRFDIILCDRVLHMLQAEARLALLRRLLDHVSTAGFCLIVDERVHIDAYRRVAAAHAADWSTEKAHRGTLFLRRAAN